MELTHDVWSEIKLEREFDVSVDLGEPSSATTPHAKGAAALSEPLQTDSDVVWHVVESVGGCDEHDVLVHVYCLSALLASVVVVLVVQEVGLEVAL